MFTQDFVLNGRGQGELGEGLNQVRFEPGLLRPYVNRKGHKCCTVNVGNKYDEKTGEYKPQFKEVLQSDLIHNGHMSPVMNATTLRKDEWQLVDQIVLKAARERLRAWQDLINQGLTFGGFNGMAKTLLEHETMDDPGKAIVDMDGLGDDNADSPTYQLEGLPLPITHSGFNFSQRKLAVSRNGGMPLDITMAEAAGRRVAESIEKTLIGTVTGTTFGTAADYGRAPTVFGYTNFTDRNTKTNMNAPTGANGPTILSDWLALRDLLYSANMFGPYMAYVSSDYDEFLDNLFSTTEPSAGTLRSRLLQIDQIQDIRRLDFLTDTFTVVLVQMTPDVVRAVNGMDITTVQWEGKGGLELNFKVMAIQVPQLRADNSGNCGIAHGTTA